MHFSALYTIFFVIVSTGVGADSVKLPKKSSTGTSGRYIVSLKPGVNRNTVKSHHGIVTTADYDWDIINAFVIEGNNNTVLEALLDDPRVQTVEEDGIARAASIITESNAPWGLQRISTDKIVTGTPTALNYTFTYNDAYAGRGVDAYVIDTGIRTTHREFEPARARWGATFGGYASVDGNGHGTHVAGIIGGTQFGVAKLVSLIAVKVLADTGVGTWSDVISGINWAVGQAQSLGRPSIINLSLGGTATDAVDNAVNAAINAGVHVVVAAGNSNADACGFSPARTLWAVTVGASTISDTKASPSNFGSCVDFYAPGQDVISSWSTSDTAVNSLSGTSMAAPHVSGIIAYIISQSGSKTIADMGAQIWGETLKWVMPDNPSPNALAYHYFL